MIQNKLINICMILLILLSHFTIANFEDNWYSEPDFSLINEKNIETLNFENFDSQEDLSEIFENKELVKKLSDDQWKQLSYEQIQENIESIPDLSKLEPQELTDAIKDEFEMSEDFEFSIGESVENVTIKDGVIYHETKNGKFALKLNSFKNVNSIKAVEKTDTENPGFIIEREGEIKILGDNEFEITENNNNIQIKDLQGNNILTIDSKKGGIDFKDGKIILKDGTKIIPDGSHGIGFTSHGDTTIKISKTDQGNKFKIFGPSEIDGSLNGKTISGKNFNGDLTFTVPSNQNSNSFLSIEAKSGEINVGNDHYSGNFKTEYKNGNFYQATLNTKNSWAEVKGFGKLTSTDTNPTILSTDFSKSKNLRTLLGTRKTLQDKLNKATSETKKQLETDLKRTNSELEQYFEKNKNIVYTDGTNMVGTGKYKFESNFGTNIKKTIEGLDESTAIATEDNNIRKIKDFRIDSYNNNEKNKDIAKISTELKIEDKKGNQIKVNGKIPEITFKATKKGNKMSIKVSRPSLSILKLAKSNKLIPPNIGIVPISDVETLNHLYIDDDAVFIATNTKVAITSGKDLQKKINDFKLQKSETIKNLKVGQTVASAELIKAKNNLNIAIKKVEQDLESKGYGELHNKLKELNNIKDKTKKDEKIKEIQKYISDNNLNYKEYINLRNKLNKENNIKSLTEKRIKTIKNYNELTELSKLDTTFDLSKIKNKLEPIKRELDQTTFNQVYNALGDKNKLQKLINSDNKILKQFASNEIQNINIQEATQKIQQELEKQIKNKNFNQNQLNSYLKNQGYSKEVINKVNKNLERTYETSKAKILETQGKTDEAQAIYDTLNREQSTSESLYGLASTNKKQGNLKLAEEYYKDALSKSYSETGYKSNAFQDATLIDLGATQLQLAKYDEANDKFFSVRAGQKKGSELYNQLTQNIANTYNAKKDYDNAIPEFEYLANNGNDKQKLNANLNLGQILNEKSKTDKDKLIDAELYYQEALKLDPKNIKAQLGLINIYNQEEKSESGDFKSIITSSKKEISNSLINQLKNSKKEEEQFTLAQLYEQQGNKEKASEYYQKVSTSNNEEIKQYANNKIKIIKSEQEYEKQTSQAKEKYKQSIKNINLKNEELNTAKSELNDLISQSSLANKEFKHSYYEEITKTKDKIKNIKSEINKEKQNKIETFSKLKQEDKEEIITQIKTENDKLNKQKAELNKKYEEAKKNYGNVNRIFQFLTNDDEVYEKSKKEYETSLNKINENNAELTKLYPDYLSKKYKTLSEEELIKLRSSTKKRKELISENYKTAGEGKLIYSSKAGIYDKNFNTEEGNQLNYYSTEEEFLKQKFQNTNLEHLYVNKALYKKTTNQELKNNILKEFNQEKNKNILEYDALKKSENAKDIFTLENFIPQAFHESKTNTNIKYFQEKAINSYNNKLDINALKLKENKYYNDDDEVGNFLSKSDALKEEISESSTDLEQLLNINYANQIRKTNIENTDQRIIDAKTNANRIYFTESYDLINKEIEDKTNINYLDIGNIGLERGIKGTLSGLDKLIEGGKKILGFKPNEISWGVEGKINEIKNKQNKVLSNLDSLDAVNHLAKITGKKTTDLLSYSEEELQKLNINEKKKNFYFKHLENLKKSDIVKKTNKGYTIESPENKLNTNYLNTGIIEQYTSPISIASAAVGSDIIGRATKGFLNLYGGWKANALASESKKTYNLLSKIGDATEKSAKFLGKPFEWSNKLGNSLKDLTLKSTGNEFLASNVEHWIAEIGIEEGVYSNVGGSLADVIEIGHGGANLNFNSLFQTNLKGNIPIAMTPDGIINLQSTSKIKSIAQFEKDSDLKFRIDAGVVKKTKLSDGSIKYEGDGLRPTIITSEDSNIYKNAKFIDDIKTGTYTDGENDGITKVIEVSESDFQDKKGIIDAITKTNNLDESTINVDEKKGIITLNSKNNFDEPIIIKTKNSNLQNGETLKIGDKDFTITNTEIDNTKLRTAIIDTTPLSELQTILPNANIKKGKTLVTSKTNQGIIQEVKIDSLSPLDISTLSKNNYQIDTTKEGIIAQKDGKTLLLNTGKSPTKTIGKSKILNSIDPLFVSEKTIIDDKGYTSTHIETNQKLEKIKESYNTNKNSKIILSNNKKMIIEEDGKRIIYTKPGVKLTGFKTLEETFDLPPKQAKELITKLQTKSPIETLPILNKLKYIDNKGNSLVDNPIINKYTSEIKKEMTTKDIKSAIETQKQAQEHYKKAKQAQLKGDIETTNKELDAALELNPTFSDAKQELNRENNPSQAVSTTTTEKSIEVTTEDESTYKIPIVEGKPDWKNILEDVGDIEVPADIAAKQRQKIKESAVKELVLKNLEGVEVCG